MGAKGILKLLNYQFVCSTSYRGEPRRGESMCVRKHYIFNKNTPKGTRT